MNALNPEHPGPPFIQTTLRQGPFQKWQSSNTCVSSAVHDGQQLCTCRTEQEGKIFVKVPAGVDFLRHV
jgi:hypothetical protein